MNRYKVEVTSSAKEQMGEIRDYIKYQLQNPDAARNLLMEMKEKVKELEYIADTIKPIEEQPWGEQGVKKIIVRNYYLYFWTDKEKGMVYVIAATYAKRNQPNVLTQIDVHQKPTASQEKMLEEAKKKEIVFDEDCPELSDEELQSFVRVTTE